MDDTARIEGRKGGNRPLGSIGAKPGHLIDVKAIRLGLGHRSFMPFYRFHVCDPINRIDGHGHDGAALADDIDAMLFAAGIIQRLVQEQPSVPSKLGDQDRPGYASGRRSQL